MQQVAGTCSLQNKSGGFALKLECVSGAQSNENSWNFSRLTQTILY